MRTFLRLVSAVTLVILLPYGAFAKDVKVEKKKPNIEKKKIDKENPPKLEPGEDGVTFCDFSCEPVFAFEGKPAEEESKDACQVTIVVSVESVAIDLDITEWLPEEAVAQLKDHEDGHTEICEEAYEDAKKAAGEAAKKFGKKTITGKGKNCEEATEDARNKAISAFCDDYHGRTQAVAERVFKIYDDLTEHGKKKKPAAKDAVKKAFEKEKEKQKEKK